MRMLEAAMVAIAIGNIGSFCPLLRCNENRVCVGDGVSVA